MDAICTLVVVAGKVCSVQIKVRLITFSESIGSLSMYPGLRSLFHVSA